jgi:hypothetical protein
MGFTGAEPEGMEWFGYSFFLRVPLRNFMAKIRWWIL